MKFFLLFLIRIYQALLSPIFVFFLGHTCRFTPTCSEYSYQAIQKYGAIKGLRMGLARFVSCRPGGRSGYDPVQ